LRHWAEECWEHGGKRCNSCGAEGHFSDRCPTYICSHCSMAGHTIENCEHLSSSYHPHTTTSSTRDKAHVDEERSEHRQYHYSKDTRKWEI
jgi:hypothetical protein